MDRTILILGAGVMQIPAVRAARRLGLHVVVADANTTAPAIEEADEFLHVDLKDHEAMARAAAALRERRGLDAVFTAGTDFSATVAWVAEKLGLPGNAYEAALDATDKFRMRRVLREAGVAVPEFAVLSRAEIERSGCASVDQTVRLPVVVKPVDSMGGRGVVRADSWDEAEAFAREAVAYSRSGRVVVEGYIDGPEFSLDAIVYKDDIQITGFADRHILFPPYFIEMGHTIPTDATAEVQASVIEEFKRAIRALRIGPGAAKGDVKYLSSGAVIGEVAARLSGGYMSGWTYPLSSGVPLTEIGIRVALGDVPPRARPSWNRTCAERAIISIPGRLTEIRGVDAARASGAISEIFLNREAGDAVAFPRNNVEKIGNVIAVDSDRAVAVRAATDAVRSIVPVLEPLNRETDRFLFEPDSGSGPLPPEYRNWAFEAWGEAHVSNAEWRELTGRVRDIPLHITVPTKFAESEAKDWSYSTPREILDALETGRAFRLSFARTTPSRLDATSRAFFRAIAKGGLQGAQYALDSLSSG
ncbi:MAG: ATP-grasp domain-containing protein [Spirochaetota bacterium]